MCHEELSEQLNFPQSRKTKLCPTLNFIKILFQWITIINCVRVPYYGMPLKLREKTALTSRVCLYDCGENDKFQLLKLVKSCFR